LKNKLVKKAVEFRVGGTDVTKAEKYEWAREFVTGKGDKKFECLIPYLRN